MFVQKDLWLFLFFELIAAEFLQKSFCFCACQASGYFSRLRFVHGFFFADVESITTRWEILR